ncbi:MAG TPA: YHS domain-containing protein [Roseiflexaceae bacterium]|nr:YHS domain-containing protein [Roseiflexaceae bacterium]
MSATITLGSPVQCRDTSGGMPFLRPRVSGVVLDPSASRVDYLVVHRGFIGGQDQCVPSTDLQDATPEGVTLRISLDELKAMPALEVKVPGQSFAQRSIPENFFLLDKGTPISDETGRQLGHFYGVVIGPEHRVEQILLDLPDHPGIRAEAIIACSESGIEVREMAQPVEQSAPAPSPGPTVVRDPVCDMEVDPATALRAEYYGTTYYFCSMACKQAFEADPKTYIAKERTV